MKLAVAARPASRPARSARLPLAAALLALLALFAAPRRAEACSPALPSIQPRRPAVDETAVPTNAWIWLSGDELSEVTLSDGTTAITTQLQKIGPSFRIYTAVPATPLRPGTRYTVTAKSPIVDQPKVFSFTTGASAELAAPAPTGRLRVTSERAPKGQGNSCVEPFDGYFIDVAAEPSAGAAFYRLERQNAAGAYELIGFSESPELRATSETLPSPTFRVRPVSITGLSAADDTLPVGQALDDDGGCSAAGGPSSALWLMVAAVGWALWQRRRKPRSLHSLARGDHRGDHRGIRVQ